MYSLLLMLTETMRTHARFRDSCSASMRARQLRDSSTSRVILAEQLSRNLVWPSIKNTTFEVNYFKRPRITSKLHCYIYISHQKTQKPADLETSLSLTSHKS